MRLVDKYAPDTLDVVVGQPDIVRRLKSFMVEPYPTWMAFVGNTGTGKTTCATVVGEALADPWFGVHRVSGASLDLNAVESYFGSSSPFRFATPANHFHVLRIEELELLPAKAQIAMKDAWDVCRERHWRVIVMATSNTLQGLEPALRDRFGDPYKFSSGPEFAKEYSEWLETVWMLEAGGPMPAGWQRWGFGNETQFSARRALDAMEAYLLHRKGVAV
jgi:hypothetical protein